MGRPLRRREARVREGREILLLPGLVGGRSSAASSDQSDEMERAAEDLSGDDTSLRARSRRVDDHQIRRAKPAGGEAPRRLGGPATPVPAAGQGGVLQFGERDLCRVGAGQTAIQENAEKTAGVTQ